MTTLDTQVQRKRNTVEGTLKQARGVARERLGRVKNDPKMQLAGKKDQIAGTLQKTVGNSWAYRHKNLVMTTTLAAALAAAVFYFVNRANQAMTAEYQNSPN
jgi:uncharacterized protein YjbJ (UPF0337 family)